MGFDFDAWSIVGFMSSVDNNTPSSSNRTGDEGEPSPRQPGFLSNPQLRYPNAYTWLVLVSALDLMLTMLVLYVWEGFEANPIAEAVITKMGYVWAIVFKFAIVVLVVIICEFIGRRDERGGRTLAVGAVIINAMPVMYSFVLLLIDTYMKSTP